MEYVVVTSLPHTLATIVAGALEAEGISTRVERPVLSSVYALDSGIHASRVLVRAEDEERARALITEVEAEG